MNSSIIRYILGQVIKIEGALMLLPCLVGCVYGEHSWLYFAGTSAICILLGVLMTYRKPKSNVFYLKEGCVITAFSWMLLSILGALPMWLCGEIPTYIDALFETVSGFTTTGASILPAVEPLSKCVNTWRCFTHWIGGMGVLVFILAIVPMSGGSSMNLMKAESPGPSVSKLVPKVKSTAMILYAIYIALTLFEWILLMIGGVPFLDALNTSFGTAGTGGFGIKNDSLMSFSPYVQWVVIVFMILFGVNFNAYYCLVFRMFKKAFTMEEVRYYFIIILTAVFIICCDIRDYYETFGETLRHSFFQVGSIITTTGFSSADFNTWPMTSKTILVLLMFIGACAGSTGGGIKVSRIAIAFKTLLKELNSYIHPKSVKKIQFEKKPVEHDVLRALNVYLISFFLVFASSIVLISFENYDLETNFTAVAATINNIGPGLNMVGPTQNFSFFSTFSKLVLIFDMLAGRLELFPMLILFHPTIWKQLFHESKKQVS
ncbi:MAG: TrkH family potassium uptake protein [Lachnospiraceae bacterium]|nr:TrkH family potassium uptake protein [Lachnospiraceae bacterium]